jgi:hypothetical protein
MKNKKFEGFDDCSVCLHYLCCVARLFSSNSFGRINLSQGIFPGPAAAAAAAAATTSTQYPILVQAVAVSYYQGHLISSPFHFLSNFFVYRCCLSSRLRATIQCGISMPDNANSLLYCYVLNAKAPHSVIKLPIIRCPKHFRTWVLLNLRTTRIRKAML